MKECYHNLEFTKVSTHHTSKVCNYSDARLSGCRVQCTENIEKLKDKKEFLLSLISYFHERLPENLDFAKELPQAEEWAKQNVNIRGILEYLMLKMPIVP